MEIAVFLQQLKTKKKIEENNKLLQEQNQLLKEIRDLLKLKGSGAK